MAKNPILTCLTVALLVMSQAPSTFAQSKKKSGGTSATEHARRGVELAGQGALEPALVEFTAAIEANPKDPRFYRDRGGVYLTMKRFQDAVNDFTKAIELAPKDHVNYSLRGAALNELNQFEPALADLNKALEMKPDDPQTLERRGYVYFKQNKFQEALADYNKALEQKPDSTLGLSRRADAYFRTNQLQEAKADLEKVIQLRPEDFSAQDRLMQVNARLAPPVAQPAAKGPAVAATPKPTPKQPLLTRTNVFIAIGVLLVLFIIVIFIAKAMMTKRDDY